MLALLLGRGEFAPGLGGGRVEHTIAIGIRVDPNICARQRSEREAGIVGAADF